MSEESGSQALQMSAHFASLCSSQKCFQEGLNKRNRVKQEDSKTQGSRAAEVCIQNCRGNSGNNLEENDSEEEGSHI